MISTAVGWNRPSASMIAAAIASRRLRLQRQGKGGGDRQRQGAAATLVATPGW